MSCSDGDYKIAVGSNNVAGLTAITAITDGTRTFEMPTALGSWSAGDTRINSDGTTSERGFQSVVWSMVMTTSQYAYWRTTYAGGGFSGAVTIRTTTEKLGTYANYGAIMIVPQPADIQRDSDFYTVSITFTRLAIIEDEE